MKKLITFLKSLILSTMSFLILPLMISIFNLFNIYINKLSLIIISSIIMLISGFLIGKNSNKKGFISGGFLGLIFVFILIILGLFFKIDFSFGRVIYYVILILSTMLGSIIGINKKKAH